MKILILVCMLLIVTSCFEKDVPQIPLKELEPNLIASGLSSLNMATLHYYQRVYGEGHYEFDPATGNMYFTPSKKFTGKPKTPTSVPPKLNLKEKRK